MMNSKALRLLAIDTFLVITSESEVIAYNFTAYYKNA